MLFENRQPCRQILVGNVQRGQQAHLFVRRQHHQAVLQARRSDFRRRLVLRQDANHQPKPGDALHARRARQFLADVRRALLYAREYVLIQPGDVEALAGKMKALYDTYEQFDKKKIRQSIVNRFDFQLAGQKLLQVYSEALKS